MSKNFIFLCSPGLGLLDQVLPIIYKLKKIKSCKFYILFSKAETTNQFIMNPILKKISNETFDHVIFLTNYGNIFKSNNLNEVVNFNKQSKLFILIKKIAIKLKFVNLCKKIELIIIKMFYSSDYLYINKKNLDNIFSNCSGLFYDVLSEIRDFNQIYLSRTRNMPKFHFDHGKEVRSIFPNEKKQADLSNQDITCFIGGYDSKKYLMHRYNIHSKFVESGFPSYDKNWIKLILSESQYQNNNEILPEKFIFLASRPAIEPYLTIQRKKKTIIAIKKIFIEKLKYSIVIKLHPKELNTKNKQLYFEVLGKNNFKKTWFFSSHHPYHLSKKCAFGITFFSNICVDLVKFKKLSIEILDLRKVKGIEKNNFVKDHNGDPVFDFRANNIVLGANDLHDLEEIIKDNNFVEKNFIKNYENFQKQYILNDNSVDFCLDEINKKLKLKNKQIV